MDSQLFVTGVRLKREAVPSFDAYPFCLPAIRRMDRIPIDSPVTLFVGENGSGKSTLLEAIACACGFNPEGGSAHLRFETRRSHSVLENYVTLQRSVKRPKDGYFLRAESFFNVATQIEHLDAGGGLGRPIIDSYGGRSLHEQSHGESFLTLIIERFGGQGLYILDEPEAALSPTRQLALLVRMNDLVQAGSQFLVATHSPLLLAYPGATILSLDSDAITRIAYEDTDHYQVTRRFLLDHRRAVAELLDDQATGE